jgi:hypothetical protein
MLLEGLITIVEGKRNRTSLLHRLFSLHEIECVLDGEEFEIVGCQIFKLLGEGVQGEPERVALGGGTHILILDNGEDPLVSWRTAYFGPSASQVLRSSR